MGILGKIRSLGFGFVFERAFERIIPVWMFRFCSLAVYQIDSDKLPAESCSKAIVEVCDNAPDLEQLREVTFADGDKEHTIGLVAKMDGEVAGGLWVAIGDYRDGDLGLTFSLGDEGTWIYAARVDDAYRRQGIYSHLMVESTQSRLNASHRAPLIGVSKLNRNSHRAIQRFGIPVGQVFVFRVGTIVWARAKGDIKQNRTMTLRCTRDPIELIC